MYNFPNLSDLSLDDSISKGRVALNRFENCLKLVQ
jgi:hypothetical protein